MGGQNAFSFGIEMIGETSDTEEEEFAFVQYMVCTEPMDELGNRLGCIYLRWSTDDEEGHG